MTSHPRRPRPPSAAEPLGLDGKHLVSAGAAPRNHGYLAVWDAGTGALRHGEELPLGTLYALAVSPDGQLLALGTGGGLRGGRNNGLVLKVPALK